MQFWGHPTMKIWINGKWNQFGNLIAQLVLQCITSFCYNSSSSAAWSHCMSCIYFITPTSVHCHPSLPLRFLVLSYVLQMLALTTAFCLSIRPGVTDETLNFYNTPLDQFRGFVEAVVIMTWMIKFANELHKLVV